ncbi:NFACT RNA binding domain-containing protein [Calditrichota bacterium LG25]
MKFKKFRSTSGLDIWVGMDDATNDQLTFKESHGNDLWFHVHGFPGSHVILRCGETEVEADKQSIKEAAQLAAYFSKMRNAKKVAVHYCRVFDVKKPRGAKPGSVVIQKFKKVLVQPQLILDELR